MHSPQRLELRQLALDDIFVHTYSDNTYSDNYLAVSDEADS